MKILGSAIKLAAIALGLGGIWWGWSFFQVILTGEAPLGPVWLVNWGAAPGAFFNYIVAIFCVLPAVMVWALGAAIVERADKQSVRKQPN
jgi:hypothetical protein